MTSDVLLPGHRCASTEVKRLIVRNMLGIYNFSTTIVHPNKIFLVRCSVCCQKIY